MIHTVNIMQKLKEQIIELYSKKIIDAMNSNFTIAAKDYFEDMKKYLLKIKEMEDFENSIKKHD